MGKNPGLTTRREFIKSVGSTAAAAAFGGSRIIQTLEQMASQEAFPPPEIIDGIETYVHDIPLDAEQETALVNQLDQEFEQVSRPRKAGIVYTTEYVQETDYLNIPQGTRDENYQEFLAHHRKLISEIIISADPLLSGGAELRRLIVETKGEEVLCIVVTTCSALMQLGSSLEE